MISAKKALITRPVPFRTLLAQLGFKLLNDAVKQTRGKRVRNLPFQTPITRDLAFLLSQLALCHHTGPPTN